MTHIKSVGASEFAAEVLEARQPVLVDFWAPWCGPCRMLAPVLEQVAADNAGRVRVVKVNVDENPELAGRYGVMGIPTLILFAGGQPVAEAVGFMSRGQLQQFLDTHLAAV